MWYTPLGSRPASAECSRTYQKLVQGNTFTKFPNLSTLPNLPKFPKFPNLSTLPNPNKKSRACITTNSTLHLNFLSSN